ncbi:hypothetical protein BM1_05501 [Bipolaris maydis]|nr:hypothetical protein BM1_05501 [Bipolaris maydis]KAJ5031316.1 hypothetical protein J3E73DRAFT_396156 [Bipolaris maydis]KAJ6273819.1 hypothetical protein PSV08DRAFT_218251 [Bipolaris maydis]
MFPCAERPILPEGVTTINYALDWPHLQNPSNTTFAGLTQIDICHCQRTDLSPQKDTEPGHIYARLKCVEPEVHFKTAKEDLWVLEAPHGPINMLRPATEEEKARRNQIRPDADPSVYKGHRFLFLTGPCPRGRYQAYATQKWLETLTPAARKHISCLCLLIQPYEEDSSLEATRRVYTDLAEYLVQHAPGFEKLYLLVCPNGMQLCSAASEFSKLLHSRDVKIIVVLDDCCSRETSEYDDPNVFSETMMAMARRPPPLQMVSEPPQKCGTEKHGTEVVEPSGRDEGKEEERKEDEHGEDDKKENEEEGEEHSVDGDWTDATMSPTSPQNELDKDWQML